MKSTTSQQTQIYISVRMHIEFWVISYMVECLCLYLYKLFTEVLVLIGHYNKIITKNIFAITNHNLLNTCWRLSHSPVTTKANQTKKIYIRKHQIKYSAYEDEYLCAYKVCTEILLHTGITTNYNLQ